MEDKGFEPIYSDVVTKHCKNNPFRATEIIRSIM